MPILDENLLNCRENIVSKVKQVLMVLKKLIFYYYIITYFYFLILQ